jgi:hypothetical protein
VGVLEEIAEENILFKELESNCQKAKMKLHMSLKNYI